MRLWIMKKDGAPKVKARPQQLSIKKLGMRGKGVYLPPPGNPLNEKKGE